MQSPFRQHVPTKMNAKSPPQPQTLASCRKYVELDDSIRWPVRPDRNNCGPQ